MPTLCGGFTVVVYGFLKRSGGTLFAEPAGTAGTRAAELAAAMNGYIEKIQQSLYIVNSDIGVPE